MEIFDVGEPPEDDASAAFIFSRRQVQHRLSVDCGSAGMGMTCKSSAHQQLLSGWQVMGALHLAQRVSMGKYGAGGEERRGDSVRLGFRVKAAALRKVLRVKEPHAL
jgi:hypothetical protein